MIIPSFMDEISMKNKLGLSDQQRIYITHKCIKRKMHSGYGSGYNK